MTHVLLKIRAICNKHNGDKKMMQIEWRMMMFFKVAD